MAEELALVSVVTPCLNMGRFLRECIESVLSQDYPRIEYIVMDGGSTDETVAILNSYSGRLTYWSGPDAGAADAINRGIQRSSGTILAYLNADDTLLPGAIRAAVEELREYPEAAVVYGGGHWVDGDGRQIGPYPTRAFDPDLLPRECFLCQPASFLSRRAFESVGMLDPALHYSFDYDLWIRLTRSYPMRKIDRMLATSRMHKDSKTVGKRRQVLRETLHMLRGHYGYVAFHWVHSYACNLIDGRDQFFEPLQPSTGKYILSLLLGVGYNTKHPLRFVREWASVMTVDGMVRRWHGFFHPSK